MKIILFLFTFLFSSISFSAIKFNDGVYPEIVTSARALGMGNAYVAYADDAAAAIYNPAGLGSVRSSHFHLSNVAIEINQAWTQMGTGGFITNTIGNLGKGFSLDGIRQLVVNARGKISNARIQAMPNLTFRNFSMGVLYSSHLRGTLGTAATDQFEYATRTDTGPYLAMNLPIMGGILKFGATFIYLFREQNVGQADPNVALKIPKNLVQKGEGFQVISGMKITLPVAALPIFALKMNNTLASKFKKTGPVGIDPITQSLDMAFSLTPRIGNTLRIHMEIDYKDLLKKYGDLTDRRRIQLGFEMDFARRFFLRLGYSDGFGSAGLGLKSKQLEFDLTTYAVDTTANAYRGKQDRRFILAVSSGF